jgi:hypothetical protein
VSFLPLDERQLSLLPRVHDELRHLNEPSRRRVRAGTFVALAFDDCGRVRVAMA